MPVDLFEFAAERLEQHTALDRLAARGTLRIALKIAGLSPKGLSRDKLRVVLEKVLPGELEKCGVESGRRVCTGILVALANVPLDTQATEVADTDEIFRRLGDN
jgi:hypothetical protein